MDDFKTFYLIVLITASVILLYFSFKTVILSIILAAAVWLAINVVNSPLLWQQLSSTQIKIRNKKTKPYKSKYKGGIFIKGTNESLRSEDMPSTVKLTPLPSRKTPVLNNQSFSTPLSCHRTSYTNSSICDNTFNNSLTISPTNRSQSKSSAFLPTFKRALGLSEFSHRENSLPVSPQKTDFPSQPSAGFIPAVRLAKRERSILTQSRSSTPRSPNVVRIAPPDLHRLSSPRLFHIQTSSSEPRRPPDTQAVISALKEKSLKRTYAGYDLDASYTDYPVQQAKRRRQNSQQSNSSSSSLPPLPDSLPDLASSGYTIPRLETPTLKRSAMVDDWDDSCSAKKLRKDGRINHILSSLSSSQRFAERDKQTKRKVSVFENKENTDRQTKQAKKDVDRSPLNRSDTIILPTETVNTPHKETDISVNDTSAGTPVSVDKPKLQKKITLNESFSARKRQNSLYTTLNKSFQKVPHANVIASMEDYESDMGAEKKRVQDMLEEIYKAETEKEEEKQKKEAEEKTKELKAASATTTQSMASIGVSLKTTVSPLSSVSSAAGFTLPTPSSTTLIVTSAPKSASVASNPFPFNFATVKSSSPTASGQSGLLSGSIVSSAGLSSATAQGSNTITVNSSGTSISTGFSTSTQQLPSVTSSGAPAIGGFTLGNQTASSSVGGFGTSNSVTKTTTSAGPPFNFGTNVASAATKSSGLPSYSSAVASSTMKASQPTPLDSLTQTNIPFGMQSMPASVAPTQLSSAFSFGQQPKPATTTLTQTGPTFPLGANTQPSSSTGQQSASFAFGQPSSTSNLSTGTNSSASTFGFKSFGAVSQPAQQTTTPSIFGNNSSTGAPSFGTSTTTPTFGSATSFGQGTTAATSAVPSGGFNFSAGTTSFGKQGAAGFGQPPAPNANPFGTTGSFGSTTTQAGFSSGTSFGSGVATTTSNTFGFGAATTSAASGNPFGQPTAPGTSSMPFGQPTAPGTSSMSFGQPTAPGTSSMPFGQPRTPGTSCTPFGQPTAPGRNSMPFGQPTVPGTSSMPFGQPTAPGTNSTPFGQATPNFGAPQPTTKSGFGVTGPAFGQPSFGTAKTTAAPAPSGFSSANFSFGQSSANTFGAASTQPSGSSGTFAFGGATTTTQAAGTTFNFGASTAAPSTPNNKTGFNFSAAASTPANITGGGFNFSANASFGTPTGVPAAVFGTPTGGTPNTFSVGPASVPTKPRTFQRGRRKGGKGR